MKFFITGTRRGLGKVIQKYYGNCNSLEECDVFINCKHDGFQQVEMLYKAAKLKKRIINIGSRASDYTFRNRYAVEKKALREANHYIFSLGINTTCINFGYIDNERSMDVNEPKLSMDYCVSVIDWIIKQPHRVMELTICC